MSIFTSQLGGSGGGGGPSNWGTLSGKPDAIVSLAAADLSDPQTGEVIIWNGTQFVVSTLGGSANDGDLDDSFTPPEGQPLGSLAFSFTTGGYTPSTEFSL